MRRAYQSDLSDAEWSCLEPYLPAPKATGRPKMHATRERISGTRSRNNEKVLRGGELQICIHISFVNLSEYKLFACVLQDLRLRKRHPASRTD
jgi:hypothetical protein